MEKSMVAAHASVMLYDDINKKWLPSGSAHGISKVQIFQHTLNNTFRVVGWKIQDKDVVINCAISKSLRYNQATATFHQWRDNKQVYGLNFASKEDADNFAKVMMNVLDFINASHKQKLLEQQQHQIQYQQKMVINQDDTDDHLYSQPDLSHRRQQPQQQLPQGPGTGDSQQMTAEYAQPFPIANQNHLAYLSNQQKQGKEDGKANHPYASQQAPVYYPGQAMSTSSSNSPHSTPPQVQYYAGNQMIPPPEGNGGYIHPSCQTAIPPPLSSISSQPEVSMTPQPPPAPPAPSQQQINCGAPPAAPPPPPPPPVSAPSVATVVHPPATPAPPPPPPPPPNIPVPPPPPPLAPPSNVNEEEDWDDTPPPANSLAAQLKQAKLKKIQSANPPPPPPPAESLSASANQSKSGTMNKPMATDIMSEMQRVFAARKKKEDSKSDVGSKDSNTESQIEGFSVAQNVSDTSVASSNRHQRSTSVANGETTISRNRRFMSIGGYDSGAHPVGTQSSSATTCDNISNPELEELKKEILQEVRKEIQKAKTDIISAIRQEFGKR